MKQRTVNFIIAVISIFIITSLAVILVHGATSIEEALRTNSNELKSELNYVASESCEHEFEYRFSASGSPCTKCGRYCCTHEYNKWVGGTINTIVCQDCGLAY